MHVAQLFLKKQLSVKKPHSVPHKEVSFSIATVSSASVSSLQITRFVSFMNLSDGDILLKHIGFI
jgi:hypothetical protein